MNLREADLMYSGNTDATYEDIYGDAPVNDVSTEEPVVTDAKDETIDIDSVKSLVKQLGTALGLVISDPAEEDLPPEETPPADDLGPGYPEV